MSDANEFEDAITRALDRKPEVRVPADFAAKVRASLPAQPKVRAQRSVGRMAAGVGTAGLVVALCCWLRMRGLGFRIWRLHWKWCWWWSW